MVQFLVLGTEYVMHFLVHAGRETVSMFLLLLGSIRCCMIWFAGGFDVFDFPLSFSVESGKTTPRFWAHSSVSVRVSAFSTGIHDKFILFP